MSKTIDWIAGDTFGLQIPAHIDALREGGTSFLTEAFRKAVAIDESNSVTGITRFEECPGGGTGAKLYLSLEYEKPAPGLPTDLFVKFSRAFGNDMRDRQKIQMESEVWLALLSRVPEFPVSVPKCMFADYHRETGTGILITEQVAFGEGGIEPNYVKCLDRDLPEPLAHYQALVRALARLAGAYHAGVFPRDVMVQLENRQGTLGVSEREPYSAQQIARRAERWREFATAYPQLVPAHVRRPEFLERFAAEAPRFCGHESAIERFLNTPSPFVALGHWNANTDNAWFWRGDDGTLECGLFDWGNATVMNVAVALAGCFYGAEPEFIVENLDLLIRTFTDDYERVSGIPLDPEQLKHHLALQVATSGLMWMIDAPKVVEMRVPDLADVPDWFDPRVFDDELVRTQLHMSAIWLTLWQELDFGAQLDRFVKRNA
ncbi:MAG: hypothetical protein H6917_01435 [Novosphingobium sp.]|nr:hypothetical protein [Novosphingobium sp.]MCP5401032.1 hypothetical protein [Novosphingobium sp.]